MIFSFDIFGSICILSVYFILWATRMTKTKNILALWCLSLCLLWWLTVWAKVSLQDIYSDTRFQPIDQLHTSCSNSADILFSPQWQKITKFTIVLYYNPEKLEILRVLPKINDGNATSKIEYNKIILEVKNPTFTTSTDPKTFFQLYFKSDSVGSEILTIGTWSQAFTANKTYPLQGEFTLNFAKVPECEPDIIPPNLSLIYPKDTTQRIYLDQYFVFDIKDIGKGIDKNSITIKFDGEKYMYGSDNLKRNGNYLTFYPSKWIPLNKSLDLNIIVADQQSYGWANTTESTYTFKSATGISLNKQINPMMFRRIAQEAQKISASIDECTLLAELYTKSEVVYQQELKSIIQKVWCEIATLDTSKITQQNNVPKMNIQQKQYRNITVFATLGWILFFITFTLKIHYIIVYKKHKRLHEESKRKQNQQ